MPAQDPIFVVGCRRSGTSLLRDLLRSHPRLSFPLPSFFIPKLYRAYGDPCDGYEARRLASIVLRIDWVRKWGLKLIPSDFESCRSYRELVSRLFEAWARNEGKHRWGDKTPDYVADIPTILEIFPSAKIIHIYRDGRDVALSWLRSGYGVHNIFMAAARWKECVNAGRTAGAAVSANSYTEVRYETLLSHPESTLRDICVFLGESYCPEMLKPNFLERQPYPLWVGAREPTWVSEREIVSSNSGKWKTAMLASDLALFESVAGDLLEALGYEAGEHRRRTSLAACAWWKLHNRLRTILWRLNTKRKRRWVPSLFILQWAVLRSRLRRRHPSGSC
jgi:hypothetical protein